MNKKPATGSGSSTKSAPVTGGSAHQKQLEAAKRDSTRAALWTSLVAVLVVVLVVVGFYMRAKEAPVQDAALYSDLGKVTANLGGTRLVQVGMQLEVKDDKGRNLIAEQRQLVNVAITESFNEIQPDEIYSVEGKLRLQTLIRQKINQMLGKRVVKDVLFSNFVMGL